MNKIRDIFPLRIIKTSIAVFLAMLLAPFFNVDTFFASIGSLKSMRESLTLSIQSLFEQLFANFIGFIFAIIYTYIFGVTPFSIAFSLFSLFMIIKIINFPETYLTAAFTMFAIMILSDNNTELISRGLDRFFSTTFGMVIALIVNAILFKPKKQDDLKQILFKINEFIHIYLQHGFEDYTYFEIKNSLELLDKEKEIILAEQNTWFKSTYQKQLIEQEIKEIEITQAQVDSIFSISNLTYDFQQEIIPIILRLNFIKHYKIDDIDEITDIKKKIRLIYYEYTDDTNFYTHTDFLSKLNIYINLLRDNKKSDLIQ